MSIYKLHNDKAVDLFKSIEDDTVELTKLDLVLYHYINFDNFKQFCKLLQNNIYITSLDISNIPLYEKYISVCNLL